MTSPSDILKQAFSAVFQEEFSDVTLDNVELTEDVDSSGDPIIRVKFVFDVGGGRLEPEKVKGLLRHLRDSLSKLDESRFPIVSFERADERTGEAA